MVAISTSPVRSGTLLLALALGTSALGACGTGSSGDRAAEPTSEASPRDAEASADAAGGLPECSDVWVDGLDLPEDYTACSEDGARVKPEKKMCGFGSPMIIHDERYYALRGNRVNDVGDTATSEQFKSALAACQA